MGGGVKFKCSDVKNIIDEDGNFWFFNKKLYFWIKYKLYAFYKPKYYSRL
jgi:hypothetical protein